MIKSSTDLNTYVTKSDLKEKSFFRSVFDVFPPIPEQDNMVRGSIDFFSLQEGLSVHFSSACDVQDLEIVRECQPRLCVSFFLEGNIEAYIGDDPIPMPTFDPEKQIWYPIASVFSQCETEVFKRISKRGSYIKKLVITIAPEWLQKFTENSAELESVKSFIATHMARKNWVPSPHSTALIEQIIASGDMPDFLRRLYIESRVIMLLEEAFRKIADYDGKDPLSDVRPQDRQRLKSIEQFLQTRVGQQMSASELASKLGISVNSLQRLITKTCGMSASKFIRTFMLEKAREAMEREGTSIAEAAYLAGYNSPANFTTAFKKCFGFPPSSL